MVDVNNVTGETDDYLATTTDGYHGTSAHTYQLSMAQNMTTDEHWLHYNTTDVYQNATTGDNTIDEEITGDNNSALLFSLLIFKWTLCPFILAGNALTIIVIKKHVKKTSPTHIVIAFLALAGFVVGITDLLNFISYLVHSKYIYDLMFWISLVATGLNMSAIFLIAFERCCLTTL